MIFAQSSVGGRDRLGVRGSMGIVDEFARGDFGRRICGVRKAFFLLEMEQCILVSVLLEVTVISLF